jgi:hypothetical protein
MSDACQCDTIRLCKPFSSIWNSAEYASTRTIFQRSTPPDEDMTVPATPLFGLFTGADHIDDS